MKKLTFIIPFLTLVLITSVYGQAYLTLTFTGDSNNAYTQLSTIRVKNLTKGVDTVLNFPDTVLIMNIAGVNVNHYFLRGFTVMQTIPDPFNGQSVIRICIPEKDKVGLTVTNLLGEKLLESERVLEKGTHSFLFKPGGGGIFLICVRWKEEAGTLKIPGTGQCYPGSCTMEYKGYENKDIPQKSAAVSPDFWFSLGDALMLIGYSGDLESGFTDAPATSQDYIFQFASNTPCIGAPVVVYEGQTYNTIQVFSQCWLKENLNVGVRINAPQSQLDNNIIEKYCMGNDPDECDRYGGIYMWEELMQYSNEEGTRGICPPGWHVPTDADWQVLEGSVDSQYGIGHQIWAATGIRGLDDGTKLKSDSGWFGGGNGTDLFGFTAISGGFHYYGMGWAGGSLLATFYTSSHAVIGSTVKPFHRNFSWMWENTSRETDLKEHARPIRCLKD